MVELVPYLRDLSVRKGGRRPGDERPLVGALRSGAIDVAFGHQFESSNVIL